MDVFLPHPNKILRQSDKGTSYQTISAQFGDGYSQGAADGLDSEVDTWEIIYTPLSGTPLAELKAFLTLVGGHEAVVWLPPNEDSPKRFRVVPASIKHRNTNQSQDQISFSLIQIFEPDPVPTPPV